MYLISWQLELLLIDINYCFLGMCVEVFLHNHIVTINSNKILYITIFSILARTASIAHNMGQNDSIKDCCKIVSHNKKTTLS